MRTKTKKQTTKRGRRLDRALQRSIRAAKRVAVDHVLPIGVNVPQTDDVVYVAYTARAGDVLDVGLCDRTGELLGRLRMQHGTAMQLMAQIRDTIAGPRPVAA